MRTALLVNSNEKSTEFLTANLRALGITGITAAESGAAARRAAIDGGFDIAVINAPLPDESGENLSKFLAENEATEVILIVRADFYDEVSARVEDFGVITVSKPVNRDLFWNALKIAKAVRAKLSRVKTREKTLEEAVFDMKTVNRAKYILIAEKNFSESEAHAYLERQAMNARVTKREAAETVIKLYERGE